MKSIINFINEEYNINYTQYKNSDYIFENQTLMNYSNINVNDIIELEKLFSNFLVNTKFNVKYYCSKPELCLDNNDIEFHPMGKEINHVIAHMIESYLNPKAILNYSKKYSNKTSEELDIKYFDTIKLEIKTSYNNLSKTGATSNHQKLYFSSKNQYKILSSDPNALLLYIHYELDKELNATIKNIYLRSSNLIEATPIQKIDKTNKNVENRKETEMCITKLIPITSGNGNKNNTILNQYNNQNNNGNNNNNNNTNKND